MPYEDKEQKKSERTTHQFLVFFFLFMISVTGISIDANVSSALIVSPPAQPQEGPGGRHYTHRRVIGSVHGYGDLQFYLFQPDDPKPNTAPLIVFTHGFGVVNPNDYGAWIEHLVRKGNIVVYPVYQSWGSLFKAYKYTSNCITAILQAIELLQSEEGVKPDLDKFATVGHSVGGILAPNIAALAQQSGLPVPRAVMSLSPAKSPIPPLEDLSLIPSGTLLLVIMGDREGIPKLDSKKIFYKTSRIPLEDKDYIILISDDYGDPPLIADHHAPLCDPYSGKSCLLDLHIDAIDFNGYWRLLDALLGAAFYGENREYALGNTLQQRYMGTWSDGVPVRELFVTDCP